MRRAARWTVMAALTAGMLVAAAGCGKPAPDSGGSASGGSAPSGSSGGSSPAQTAGTRSPGKTDVTTVTATVTRGKVQTARRTVKVHLGSTVRITVTSDAGEEFHLHGYDRELELQPGRPGTLQLVADKPGVFEAELHHSGARVFELQVS
ncbi:hypothetical protein J4573_46880 [Actinomadura barringtoniae]|uniref:EfeO-type cupredoxin-like domain-containing protein n=1 Tax=Actinomadura barringtoniae TaxID=1427535 RepID=A0A939PTB1_9ACTN|nr:hypothetical protein [Actinomadura barringtoniae]MBO2454684.1 hypothetical protein [Actinomadura barringtoniae]